MISQSPSTQITTLRSSVQAAGLAIAEVDYSTNLVELSANAARLLGFGVESLLITRDELVSRIHLDDRARYLQEVEITELTGPNGRMVIDVRIQPTPDESRWVRIHKHFSEEQLGQFGSSRPFRPQRSTLAILDIHEERESLLLAQANREYARSIFEANSDCVKVLDLSGHLIDMNQNGRCMMEIGDFASVEGTSWSDFWPAETQAQVDRAVADAAGGQVTRFEAVCPTMGGKLKWWDVLVAPIREKPDGAVVQVLATSRDVTERKRSELLLAAREEEIRQMTESSPNAIIRVNMEGKVTFHNSKARWFCPDHGSLLGLHVADLPAERHVCEELKEGVAESLAQGCRVDRDFLCMVEGEKRGYRALYIPEYGLTGERAFTLCVVQDVTANLRAAKEIEEAMKEAESANRAKDRFLAALSHELRNPLSVVSLLAESWASNPPESQDLADGLEIIQRNVKVVTKLMDDLFDFNRIVRGKIALDIEDLRLGDEVAAAVSSVMPAAVEKQITIHFDRSAFGCEVRADSTRLQQIIGNLLRNAIKFTGSGGRISIECATTEDGHAAIKVVDSGMGIEPAMLESLFEPFEQGGSQVTRKYGGLGLGLAICKSLVTHLGGSISAHSDGRGHGATFTVLLPLAAPAACRSGASVN